MTATPRCTALVNGEYGRKRRCKRARCSDRYCNQHERVLGGATDPDAAECSVCYAAIGRIGTVQLECSHRFCYDCIERWVALKHRLRQAKSCPCCRAVIPEAQAYSISPMLEVIDYEPKHFATLGMFLLSPVLAHQEQVQKMHGSVMRYLEEGVIEQVFQALPQGLLEVRLQLNGHPMPLPLPVFDAARARQALRSLRSAMEAKLHAYDMLVADAEGLRSLCRRATIKFAQLTASRS